MAEDPDWFKKLSSYLTDAIVLHETDIQVGTQIRKFIKWWLEQIRNLLAVSAFYFLAQKSDSTLLKALATVTGLLFFGYFTAWPNNFHFRFFPYIQNQRANFLINFTLWLAVCMPIYFLICLGIMRALTTLTTLTPK